MVHSCEKLVCCHRLGVDMSNGNGGRSTLVLMAGMPGTGKSTLARAIGVAFGWPVIDKDVIVTSLLDSDVAEPVAQPASYAAMFALGLDILTSQRRSVILDSPAGLPVSTPQAQTVADAAGATLVCILCLADRETRNARVAGRPALRSQPVRVSRTLGDGRERYAHLPDGTIAIDMTQPLDEALREAIERLTTLLGGSGE